MHGRTVEVVGEVGAALAALLPARREHEVVDDQLAAPGEQVGQGLPAVGAVEPVGLIDTLPGQLPAPRAEAVAPAGELLLLGQQRRARGQPLLVGYDLVLHPGSPL